MVESQIEAGIFFKSVHGEQKMKTEVEAASTELAFVCHSSPGVFTPDWGWIRR